MDLARANREVVVDLIGLFSSGGVSSVEDSRMALDWLSREEFSCSTTGVPKVVNMLDDYFEYRNEFAVDRAPVYKILDKYTKNLGG